MLVLTLLLGTRSCVPLDGKDEPLQKLFQVKNARSTHGLQGAFLFCEAGKVTYDSLILKLNNNLCCDGPGKRPWVTGFFRCGPGPIWLLTPKLMLVLIITHLVQLVKN